MNDKYDDAGILIRPIVKLESEMDIDPKTCSHGELVVNCSACAEIEKLIEENARLQSVIDEANAQEPVDYERLLNGEWVKCSKTRYEVTSDPVRALYALPIPAQQSPGVSDYEEVLAIHRELVRELDVLLNGASGAAKQASLCGLVSQVAKVVRAENAPLLVTSDKMLFNGSHGHAGYVIEEQQSPAVAVPESRDREMLVTLMSAFDTEHTICAQCGNQEETMYMDSANMLRNYLADNSIKFAVQSPRITEQEDIATIEQLVNDLYSEIEARFTPETLKYESMKRKYDNDMDTVNRGRALLAKLNKPESVGG